MFSKFAAAATLATVNATASDHWAVIVAGSLGFGNYRHQADTCHAYQILKKNGIPEDQIVMISYDDVATDKGNPFPGKLFNKPAPDSEGEDVYAGCNIDYKGDEATAHNLMSVLKGDPSTGRKVLGSDANSKVFFYFADHGAPGILAMPVGGYLYADELHQTFQFMNENKMYKEMVVYIEACESGSMFEKLEDNMNIYAVTAANAHESSWGTYCSPDDKINGKSLGTCLGDLFSVNWMEDSEKAKMNTETLDDQFKTVQKLTASHSHVLQFGQLSLDTEPLADFQSGTDAAKEQDWWKVLKNKGKMQWGAWAESHLDQRKSTYAVDSRDIQLHYLYNKVMQEATPENHQALNDELNHRMKVDSTMEQLFGHHFEAMKNGTTPTPTDFECYRKLIKQYEEQCEKLDDYSMKYLKTFAAECEAIKAYPAALDATMHRLDKVCPKTA